MAALARSKIENTLVFGGTGRAGGPRFEGGGRIAEKIMHIKNVEI